MSTVVICAAGVANFPDGGGHFWVYMQYAHALQQLGCNVYWIERFHATRDLEIDRRKQAVFFERMAAFGLEQKAILYLAHHADGSKGARCEYVGATEGEALSVFRNADLLLNFEYGIEPTLLSQFRRTALVDVDPGLLQFWMRARQIELQPHDVYLTTGENIAGRELVPGPRWTHVKRPVCLDLWPVAGEEPGAPYTTVSSWWGGYGAGEWVTDGQGLVFENNKRVTFMQYLALPQLAPRPFELALYLGEGDPVDPPLVETNWTSETPCPSDVTDYVSDAIDRRRLESQGWRIQHSADVAGTPDAYRSYIRRSYGEFSCAKPSCMRFQNAWISDRTLCYLASGKPAVVQHTGPSAFLPSGDGLFRFHSMDEALDALNAIEENRAHHCRAARALAEAHFDARHVLSAMLNVALHASSVT